MTRIDIGVIASIGSQIPLSVKWRQISGTTEQMVRFETMCLADAVNKSQGKFSKAYIVLGGEGWKLREYYLSEAVGEYLKNCDSVKIVSLETFVAMANKGKL